jgi:transcription termination factor Rho
MSVGSSEALERSVLESKDREQLLAIAAALGVKATSRAKKADIITKILEQTGAVDTPAESAPPSPRGRNGNGRARADRGAAADTTADPVTAGPAVEGNASDERGPAGADTEPTAPAPVLSAPPPAVLSDQEPMAEWELALGPTTAAPADGPSASPVGDGSSDDARFAPTGPSTDGGDGTGQGNRRRRRRNRDRNRGDGPQGVDRVDSRFDRPAESYAPSTEAFQGEPVAVAGFLDLRDEGYGFLRVNGYLPSREDVYVSVKQTRQYGLRKGDHVAGMSRPAARNEKNPALLRIDTVNGLDPDEARDRLRFEDLTPLFPDERLRLEGDDPTNMTARIIDLISPIGKGQRGLIVSPPKAGKTTIMKTIATAIERNNPEVKLMVLLVDERPEEVTDMRRTVKGEVVASTFDRPSEEHTHVAELAIERAKRLVEMGEDVVVILDGITRLARAYNLAAPATGRIMSGGIDAGALYPPKKFFGAARNIEEGGSLTVLATALVETNSRMDEAIFEEFKGTGNMELRLDRKLAERRVYPAIDVDASSTRHEELLFDRKQLQMVWKLRRVLSGLADGGSGEAGLNLLTDRLKTFRNNEEFLAEIARQPSM